jgi:hypothetical protein
MSAFETWFTAQHGPRNASGLQTRTDEELKDMVQAGKVAERALAARERWDAREESALYAWQAREKQ